jgi:predicted RNA binding protein YcfA (HicA-like mRNA interferase family)
MRGGESWFLMTSRALLRILKALGCVEVRQKGSHLFVRCGTCTTVVPVHPGEDIAPGTLRAIERQLQPCLGKGWLKR